MTRGRPGWRRAAAFLVFVLAAAPSSAAAYSVLAHEALVDAAWDRDIVPLLKRRFPGVSDADILAARAYAYGGSLIQDLGYYPFGSRFFSNLTHYVRSGDFIEALVDGSRNVQEYAFALGALSHYAGDNLGHLVGVNRAVPLMYPKLREKHGPEVLYAHSPGRHVMVEFAFDVLQVARGDFQSDAWQDVVGFEVATPVLERAFLQTYGLELEDVFGDIDLAIGTYRRAVSDVIPDITRAAWRDKRDDMVFTLTRADYEQRFGTNYRKPGFFARFIVMLFKIVPKIGPLRPLAFEPLTPQAERMFLDSFEQARARYRALLRTLPGSLRLADTDLDTGHPPARGVNRLADDTRAELAERLSKLRTRVPTP